MSAAARQPAIQLLCSLGVSGAELFPQTSALRLVQECVSLPTSRFHEWEWGVRAQHVNAMGSNQPKPGPNQIRSCPRQAKPMRTSPSNLTHKSRPNQTRIKPRSGAGHTPPKHEKQFVREGRKAPAHRGKWTPAFEGGAQRARQSGHLGRCRQSQPLGGRCAALHPQSCSFPSKECFSVMDWHVQSRYLFLDKLTKDR